LQCNLVAAFRYDLEGERRGVGFAHVSMGVGIWVARIGGGIAVASDFVGRE